jgi:prophage antirepressor-like protein
MALSRLDDDEKQTVSLTDTLSRDPNVQLVNEPGLYSLILGSRKPEAREFKRWITNHRRNQRIQARRRRSDFLNWATIETR